MKTKLARALTACALFALSSGVGSTEPSPVLVIVTFGAYPLAKDLIMIESIKSMWDGIAEAINDR